MTPEQVADTHANPEPGHIGNSSDTD